MAEYFDEDGGVIPCDVRHFAKSLWDTFCLSPRWRIRGTSDREPQARASIARHVCFMYHESKMAPFIEKERKRERWRNLEDDILVKKISRPKIDYNGLFIEIVSTIDKGLQEDQIFLLPLKKW